MLDKNTLKKVFFFVILIMVIKMKLIIGSHVSFNKDEQLVKSVKEAISYNANTFMFYTGAPQNTNRSELNLEKIEEAN